MRHTDICSPNGDQSGDQLVDITITTHYDITMGNDDANDTHCEIIMGNDVVKDIYICDFTMSNNISTCTYHGITIHNDIAMNLSII